MIARNYQKTVLRCHLCGCIIRGSSVLVSPTLQARFSGARVVDGHGGKHTVATKPAMMRAGSGRRGSCPADREIAAHFTPGTKTRASMACTKCLPAIACVAGLLALVAGPTHGLTVWPKPQRQTGNGPLLALRRDTFEFTVAGQDSDILRDALRRYVGLVLGRGSTLPAAAEAQGAASAVVGLDVDVKSGSLDLTIDTDESYMLTIAAPRATLTAPTVYGALRGLESFSQLVNGGMEVNATTITDKPRFHFRATMIDTSRHW